MRIKLKYPDVRTFIERYAQNISPGGIFITTRAPKPVGTRLRFEFLLDHPTEPTSLIRGEGLVQWTRDFDPKIPAKSHGMGVKFTQLDDKSTELVTQMLAYRNQQEAAAVASAKPTESEHRAQVEEKPKRPTVMGDVGRLLQPVVKVPPEIFSVEDVLQLVEPSPAVVKPTALPSKQKIVEPSNINQPTLPRNIPVPPPRTMPVPPPPRSKAVLEAESNDPIARLCLENGIATERLEKTTERFRLRRGDAMRELEDLLRKSKKSSG